MTAGYAVELADGMRPNNEFDDQLKQNWLRECDARLRSDVVSRYAKGAFADAGADVNWSDGLERDTVLLVPEDYAASVYPHWLCAQMDLALGETARAANELQVYQDAVKSFTDWMQRTYPEESGRSITAGLVIGLADALRPDYNYSKALKENWLRECDAQLRSDVVEKNAKGAFAGAGADVNWNNGLEYGTVLLVPESYAVSVYTHWLCAQMDLAKADTARAANELQLYQEAVQNFTNWLRRTYPTESGGEMTAGLVIGLADGLRPDYHYSRALKENWLRECDARLRRNVVEKSRCGDFDAVGADVNWADGLPEDAQLLAPEAFRGVYTHWLCAQMDLAKGESDRGVNEMQLYNDAVQEFAVWMRRTYPPAGSVQWRY